MTVDLQLWYRALASPFGIEIVCSPNPEAVRMKLYALRKSVQDTDLNQIAICLSPIDPDKLWLVKRRPAKEVPSAPT